MIEQIQKGKAEFIKRSSLSRAIFRIKYEDKFMKVVYDKNNKTIVTVMKD